MSDHLTYDVVVVGGRVAGAATAMLLARAGRRVLLVDREQEGRDTLSTHALMRPAVVQLRRWGLLDRIVAAGTPPVRAVTFRYADAATTIPLDTPLFAPRRTVLDPILVDAARTAGAQVRRGVHIDRLVRDAGGRVTGVAGRHAGRPFRAAARIVVGADGRTSAIARDVGATVTRSSPMVGAVVYGYWADVDVTGYEFVFADQRSGGAMPTNDGLTCVWASAPAPTLLPRLRGDREHVLLTLLHEASPDLAARVRRGRRREVLRGAVATVPNLTRRPWGPGWALVGDAGYHTDPLTAHGITAALRDADLLASALDAALDDPRTEVAALSAYERLRDELGDDVFSATTAISTMDWELPYVQQQHLRLSRGMQHEAATLAERPDRQLAVA